MRNQYHWMLRNPRPLPEPIEAKGRLGLYRVDLPFNPINLRNSLPDW